MISLLPDSWDLHRSLPRDAARTPRRRTIVWAASLGPVRTSTGRFPLPPRLIADAARLPRDADELLLFFASDARLPALWSELVGRCLGAATATSRPISDM